MSFSEVLCPIAAFAGVVMLAIGTWPTKRNRYLSAPDPKCQRGYNVKDPPTRSIP